DTGTQGGRGQRGGMENMGDMDMSDMADMAEAFSSGDLDMSEIADAVSSMDNAEDLQDLVGSLTQETTTVYLQVGVVVHTDTGKEKTFSILEAGDELEVLFETDEAGNEVITEMWLTGTE
ncbi:MAG: hypothetical protein LIO94_09935, partial [Clostridiales bacterium]|nr:hypothetical protein [Clostridiales bacterium]